MPRQQGREPRQQSREPTRIQQLERELRTLRSEIDTVQRNQSLETIVYNGFDSLQRVLAPLGSLAPVREFGKEKQSIMALRQSLNRPDFAQIDTDFAPVLVGGKNQKGEKGA